MSISHQFKIHGLRALPEQAGQQNVITLVSWSIRFTKGDFESFGGGETVLDTSNLAEFTPLEQVTAEQVEQWVIAAQGGESFMQELSHHHGLMLDRMAAVESSQPVSLPFVEPVPTSPNAGFGDMTIEPVVV